MLHDRSTRVSHHTFNAITWQTLLPPPEDFRDSIHVDIHFVHTDYHSYSILIHITTTRASTRTEKTQRAGPSTSSIRQNQTRQTRQLVIYDAMSDDGQMDYEGGGGGEEGFDYDPDEIK